MAMKRARLVMFAIVGTAVLTAITTGLVLAGGLNYDGEWFCAETPAWPGGTYLGQMHPFHSDFYTGYAERRGWDPCETWAADQRNSAINGLRTLGYAVTVPGAPPPGVDEFGPMGLFGQCRNPAGAYVRIINVHEGLWSCYGIVVSGSIYVGTVRLVKSDGTHLHAVGLDDGTPFLVQGLYFLTGPEHGRIRTFHEEKGTGPLSSEYWAW